MKPSHLPLVVHNDFTERGLVYVHLNVEQHSSHPTKNLGDPVHLGDDVVPTRR